MKKVRTRIQTRNEKLLLGVIGTLLNARTEIACANSTVCQVIAGCDKAGGLTTDVWRGKFHIVYDGKVIFKWNDGCMS